MKAARIHRFGPPDVIVVEDIPRPSPAPREVLVRVAAAGVGPWDALIREGKSNVSPPPPLTLGSDLSGVVEAVGSGVSQFKNGDEIYGVTNPQFVGAQAAFALAAADMVSPKPARLSSLEAASVPVVAVTAWQMLFEHARPEAGHRVIDTVGGDTRDRAFGVLKPGGILVTVVSTEFVPSRSDIRSVFFYAEVTTARLSAISALVDSGRMIPQVGSVLPLEDVRTAHEMLAG